MPLPTYVPPPGVAYFTLTAAVCGLDEDAMAGGLSDARKPLGVALRKFSACAAAAVQPAVNLTFTFFAATRAAAPGKAAKAPVALPRGAVTAEGADCDDWQERAALVGRDRRRRQLQQPLAVAVAPVCTEVLARVTSSAPSAAALEKALAAPPTLGRYASALAVLLEPTAAVNTAVNTLADFFSAQMASNASAVPALSSLYTALGAELAVVPAPALAPLAGFRRVLVAANASGATFAILAVSPVALVLDDRGQAPPSPPPPGGGTASILVGAVGGGVGLLALAAAVAAVAIARHRRARRAAARAAALVKARSVRNLAAGGELAANGNNPLRAGVAAASPPGVALRTASKPGFKRAALLTRRAMLPRGTQAELLGHKRAFAARRARESAESAQPGVAEAAAASLAAIIRSREASEQPAAAAAAAGAAAAAAAAVVAAAATRRSPTLRRRTPTP